MNIETSTLQELKAIYYDTLLQIEQLQKNLQIINQAIAQKSAKEKQPKEEVKKDK